MIDVFRLQKIVVKTIKFIGENDIQNSKFIGVSQRNNRMYHALVGNDEKIPLFDFYVFISDDVFSVAAFDIDRF